MSNEVKGDSVQNDQRRIRIGVIFGGRSGEHEVSVMSARSIMEELDPERYEVVPIGVTKEGSWVTGDVLAALSDGKGSTQPAALLPDPESPALLQVTSGNTDLSSLSKVTELDVVFPVMHGPYGEDGTMQGLLELADLPYVGAGVVGSAVGMDKAIFKNVMSANGIPVLPWRLILSSEWRQNREAILNAVERELHFPIFVKPANLGSSVGISKCKNRQELISGLDEAAAYDRRLIIEQGIDGRELEVSVLGNEEPIASVVGEIRPHREFYDYVAKYISDDSDLIIPAELESEVSDKVRNLAIRAYKAIDCAGLGRVDLLMDRIDGRLYMNEINTIPGFTRISMYPKLWEASGIGFSELLDRLVEFALDRRAEKSALKTAFSPPTE